MPTLTPEMKKRVAEQARQELARRNYEDYLVYVHSGRYRHFAHTRLIAQELQRIADGESRFVIIEMPPRHGKSMTATETFPSYYLGKNPDKRVITTAYSDTLARKFGRLNRDKLNEFGFLFNQKISPENRSTNDWSLSGKPGGMIATGIGGSITGQGADLMIIDDPFKNAEEANSPTIRQKVWDEWESTLSTRLHKGASVVVIMTRWHEDDLVARLLKNKARKWTRIRLPAIAEDEDDLLGRAIGEPLCPELGFDEEWAETKKVEVGSRTWSALFQQSPSPGEGTIVKRSWIKYYKVLPNEVRQDMLTSWDLAVKDGAKNDPVAGHVIGRTGADFYMVDRIGDRMDFTSSLAAVESLYAKHRTNRTLIEDKANGPALINTLNRKIPGIIPVNPQGSKIQRFSAIAPYFEAGNIYLPDPSIAPWVGDVVEQLVTFPLGAHDDDCDALSQAINYFMMAPEPNIRSFDDDDYDDYELEDY